MPSKKNTKVNTGHVFRGCRDAISTPQPGSSPPTSAALISSDSTGTVQFGTALHPMGLTSTALGASSYTRGATGNVQGPPLRGLYNKAVDFQWFRVPRARFIFVAVVGSTTPGTITLSGYTDPFDITNTTTVATVSSSATKTFPLSSGASKEISVPIPVDSTWKKCSSVLTVPGNVFPFTAADAGSLAVVNTVADLCFGAVFARVVGTTASVPIGSFYIEYDVEFKGPIDSSINV